MLFSIVNGLIRRVSGTIGPGYWTIRNPMRHAFERKSIGGYRAAPTLTVGKNGIMLSVQLAASSPSEARLQGQDVAARVVAEQGDLRQLHAPPQGALMELSSIPFAIWYFAPPPPGSSVKKIELRIRGDATAWDFKEGRSI